MNYTSTISTLLLAAACLLSSSNTHALTKPQMAILGGMIGSSYLLFHRKSVKGATPRYSVAKVKDVRNIFTKEYRDNLWYFFYDGFVGQVGKGSTEPFGVLGTTAYYLQPLKKGSGAFAFAYGLYRVGLDLEEHIVGLSKHKEPKVKVEAPAQN